MKFLNKFNATNRVAVQLSMISFIAGTVVFFLYLLSGEEGFAMMGLVFILIAIPLHLIMLLSVLVYAVIGKSSWKENLFASYTLILNVPIASCYFYVVMEYTNL